MTTLLLKNGRVIDPVRKFDAIADVLIRDGRIAEIGAIAASAETVIDCTRQIVCPGLMWACATRALKKTKPPSQRRRQR
jgi:dihydroorotase